MQNFFSDEDVVFAEEVGAFVRATLPDDIRISVMQERRPARDRISAWQRVLHDRGWAAPSWPKEHGGTGWSLTRQYLFKRELGRNGAPDPEPFGLQMIGPVIYTYGSEDQKRRHLPGILTGDVPWCQGFSEPGAGSDLASVRTRAVDVGDCYKVDGSKIWTTNAHRADMVFCLVRTQDAPKRQQGLSIILIDMKSPGISVRPIPSIDLEHHLNEVFFDSVMVPKENLIGEPGQGWTYAKFLLSHERIGIVNLPRILRRLERIRMLQGNEAFRSQARFQPEEFRMRLGELEADALAIESLELRALQLLEATGEVGSLASMLKVSATELLQRVDRTLWDMLGPLGAWIRPDAAMGDPSTDNALNSVAAGMLFGRASSIYGGANEIQRDLIARAELGRN